MQAAFDLMGILIHGGGYLGSGLAMDKDLTKGLIAHLGVHTPVAAGELTPKTGGGGPGRGTQVPCVVKPVASGSSIGVSIAHTRQEPTGP